MALFEYVDLPFEKIEPRWIKDNFAVLVMYDGLQWLDILTKEEKFKSTRLPDIRLYIPRLIKDKESYEKAIKQNVFEQMEDFSSMIIHLEMIPSEFFSIDAKRYQQYTMPRRKDGPVESDRGQHSNGSVPESP
jgi:hypothetical protein